MNPIAFAAFILFILLVVVGLWIALSRAGHPLLPAGTLGAPAAAQMPRLLY